MYPVYLQDKPRYVGAESGKRYPTNLGGVAVPDFNLYYLAAQLSHLYHKIKLMNNGIKPGSAPVLGSFLHTLCVQWCVDWETPLWLMITLAFCSNINWDLALIRSNAPMIYGSSPFWYSKLLPELLMIPYTEIWASKGVYYLCHFYTSNGLKPFKVIERGIFAP